MRLDPTDEPPGDTGRHPGDTGRHPGDTGRHPGDTGRHPGDTGRHPGDTGRHPGDASHRCTLCGHVHRPGESHRVEARLTEVRPPRAPIPSSADLTSTVRHHTVRHHRPFVHGGTRGRPAAAGRPQITVCPGQQKHRAEAGVISISCNKPSAPNAGSRRSSAPSYSPVRSRRRSSRCVHGRTFSRRPPRRTRRSCIKRRGIQHPTATRHPTGMRRRMLMGRWSRRIPRPSTTPPTRIRATVRAPTESAARCRLRRSTRRTCSSPSARRPLLRPSYEASRRASSLPRLSTAHRRGLRSTDPLFFSRLASTSGRRPS